MKLTRLCALLLALLTLTVTLAACGDGDGNGTSTDAITTEAPAGSDPTPGETTRLYPDFPDKSYGGTPFNILRYDSEGKHGWTGIPNDIMINEGTGEVLNDAVYARNRSVSERFGVNIVAITPKASVSVDLQTSVLAGDGQYDLVDQCLNEVSRLFNLGLITSLDTIDVDLSMPWFDQNSIDSFTISGKMFAAVSDITYIDKLSTVVTFYNKAVGENIGMSSLYADALAGDWTLERMLSYASAVSSDMNSDGKMDQNDAYCISCQNDGSYFLLHSAGIKVIENNGGTLTYNLNTEEAIGALEKIFGIMNDNSIYFNRQVFSVETMALSEMFSKGQALFMIRPLQSLYDLRNYKCDFEIVPVPKYYNDQEQYFVPINTYGATIICVPKGAADYEKVSLVFEALAVESHYQVMPVFYDVVLDVKLVDNAEASKVLDTVFENRVYDLGMIWNFGSIRSSIVTANMTAIASTLKRVEKPMGKAIDALLDEIAKME